jgi:IS30 family transposase
VKEGWSPEQIAGRLGFEGHPGPRQPRTYRRICLWTGWSIIGTCAPPARSAKKRQPGYARRPRGQVFPSDRSIHQRPEHVKTRDTFGEREGDLMIFERATGKMNVASLVERKTRFAVLFRNNDRSSTHFINKLMGVMQALPQPARTSLTFDRGFEFRSWRKLPSGIGTEAWSCDP